MLPLLKLGTLALKTLSKPIAARLKAEAGRHPKFRSFIISVAQANHRITTTMQRRIYGHATDVKIRPLNEEKVVQAAVDLMGEVFVFSVLFPNEAVVMLLARMIGLLGPFDMEMLQNSQETHKFFTEEYDLY